MARVAIQDNISDWRRQVRAELDCLARMEIRAGILGSTGGELLRIAYVQEFGATITPKTARNLAIPLKPSMRGKSPREVSNTWVLDTGENRFIVRSRGQELDFLFLLVPKVTIPERSFIRAGYDSGKDRLAKACELAARAIVFEGIRADTAAHRIGAAAVGIIKGYMRSGALLPKSSITLASAPGKTSPLIQSGRLISAVAYEVIS